MENINKLFTFKGVSEFVRNFNSIIYPKMDKQKIIDEKIKTEIRSGEIKELPDGVNPEDIINND